MRPHELHDLADAERHGKADVLQHHADVAPRLGITRVEPVEQHLSGIRAPQAQHQRDRRRLARPVRAEERQDLTGTELEIDPVERAYRPERLRDGFEAGELLRHGGTRSTPWANGRGLGRSYEAGQDVASGSSGRVCEGQEPDSDQDVVRRMGADRRAESARRQVYEAKNRPGRELLRGARTLPTHMTRGKEDGARGEGPDSAERPHQRAEQEGAPDGFLLRRFDGQDECPRDQPVARDGRNSRRRNPLPSERGEQDRPRADPNRQRRDGSMDEQRVDPRCDRGRQPHGRRPPREPRDRQEPLAPTGRRYSDASYSPSIPRNLSTLRS